MGSLQRNRMQFPPLLRRVILILCTVMLVLGVMISCRQTEGDMGEFLRCMVIWLVMSLLFAGVTVIGYGIISSAAAKSTDSDLHLAFEQRGWSGELTDALKKAFRIPDGQDRVLAVFLAVMAEQFDEADAALRKVQEPELTTRELAMLRTAQLRRAVMTGKSALAHRLFADFSGMTDDAYQYQPDLRGKFTPYAEDALVYFETAAALCEREGQSGRAEQYAMQAQLRIAQYPEAAQPLLEALTALSRQYARAKTAEDAQAAKTAETALRHRIGQQPGLSAGMRANLLRMSQQCCIFGVWTQETLSASKFERKLPPPEPETPTGSNS